MVAPANYRLRIVANGTLPTGEVFNWGLWARYLTPADVTNAQLQAYTDALATWMDANTMGATGLDQLLQNDCAYTGLSVYEYKPSQAKANQVAKSSYLTQTGARTSSAPLQMSICVSLLSGQAGRSHRGRLYLPATGTPLTNHRVDATEQGYANGKILGLIDHINATTLIAGTSLRVAINSNTTGTMSDVTVVRTDNKPDTQRRRAGRFTSTNTITQTVA